MGDMAPEESQMIHGVRGLLALAATAIGIAIVLAVESPSTEVPVDRSVLAHFVEDHVDALRWARPESAAIAIERTGNGAWTLVGENRGLAEARVVSAVLSTLRSARWHRRAPRDQARAIHTTLTVHTGNQKNVTVGFGDPLRGADQAWIAVNDSAFLVDGWVVRALNVDLLALRDREPLGDVAGGTTAIRIAAEHLILDLQPQPWRDARGILSPDLVDALTGALSQLRLVEIPRGVANPPGVANGVVHPVERTTISLLDRGVSLVVGGTCPGEPQLVRVTSRDGDGCVQATRWNAVLAALAGLRQPPDRVLDRRPAAGELVSVQLPDGTIRTDGRPTLDIDGAIYSADPAQVTELRTALATPADVVATPPGTPDATIEVTLRSGHRVVLSRHGATFVRGDEPIGLRSPTVDRIARPITAYVDPTRWIEDASAVTALTIAAADSSRRGKKSSGALAGSATVTFARGSVMGEWTRAGAALPATTSARVDALAQAIAEVRAAVAQIPPRWKPICVVSVTFTPPVGAPTTHRVELGRRRTDGCLARIDGIASMAPSALCTAAMAATAN